MGILGHRDIKPGVEQFNTGVGTNIAGAAGNEDHEWRIFMKLNRMQVWKNPNALC